jgi:hypothetical protein
MWTQKFEVRSHFTTDGQSVIKSWYRAPVWNLQPDITSVGKLLSEICGLLSVGLPFWREDGSGICSVITQWSESRKSYSLYILHWRCCCRSETKTSSFYWVHLSRLPMKTETESSLRNVALQLKDRTIAKVQNCDSCINILSSQI